MWGRAQSKNNCRARKLKWVGDDLKKTKRDCSQIEIIETEVFCDTGSITVTDLVHIMCLSTQNLLNFTFLYANFQTHFFPSKNMY